MSPGTNTKRSLPEGSSLLGSNVGRLLRCHTGPEPLHRR